MSLTQSLFSSFSKKWRPVLRGIPEEIPRNRFTVDKTWPSNNRLESIWNCPGTYLTNSLKCTFTSNQKTVKHSFQLGICCSNISEMFRFIWTRCHSRNTVRKRKSIRNFATVSFHPVKPFSNDWSCQMISWMARISFQIFLAVMADFMNRDGTLRENLKIRSKSNISHRLGSAKMIQTKTFSEWPFLVIGFFRFHLSFTFKFHLYLYHSLEMDYLV